MTLNAPSLRVIRQETVRRLQSVPGFRRASVSLGRRPRIRVEVDAATDIAAVHFLLRDVEAHTTVDVVRVDDEAANIKAD